MKIKRLKCNLEKGFTIIEILVVLTIIGILGTTVVSTTRDTFEKGQVGQLAFQLDQIEKAFLYTYLDENRDEWWTEDELGINNPTLNEILNIPDDEPLGRFSTYFTSSPLNTINSSEYQLDNDGNESTSCTNGQRSRGVNIVIRDLVQEDREALEEFFDPEFDPTCGKVRYSNNPGQDFFIFFRLDFDQNW